MSPSLSLSFEQEHELKRVVECRTTKTELWRRVDGESERGMNDREIVEERERERERDEFIIRRSSHTGQVAHNPDRHKHRSAAQERKRHERTNRKERKKKSATTRAENRK